MHRFSSTFCTSGLPSGICLRQFFENTRDLDCLCPTLAPRAFQKISDSNTQWSPQERSWVTLRKRVIPSCNFIQDYFFSRQPSQKVCRANRLLYVFFNVIATNISSTFPPVITIPRRVLKPCRTQLIFQYDVQSDAHQRSGTSPDCIHRLGLCSEKLCWHCVVHIDVCCIVQTITCLQVVPAES